jgi:N utilization substance protein A
LSRSHPNLVRRLFETYVAEISGGMVEIRGIAREAGFRTKIAVWSNDKKINPVKSCIGKSGETIKKIVSVLNNEKIDIIRWSENPVIFVKRALNPARLESITLDQENEIIHATADEANLGKAIGRKGQNARLASRLIGWDVQVQLDESK